MPMPTSMPKSRSRLSSLHLRLRSPHTAHHRQHQHPIASSSKPSSPHAISEPSHRPSRSPTLQYHRRSRRYRSPLHAVSASRQPPPPSSQASHPKLNHPHARSIIISAAKREHRQQAAKKENHQLRCEPIHPHCSLRMWGAQPQMNAKASPTWIQRVIDRLRPSSASLFLRLDKHHHIRITRTVDISGCQFSGLRHGHFDRHRITIRRRATRA